MGMTTGGVARAGVQSHTVFDDGRVKVVSDAALSKTAAAALAHRVERFYDWDTRQTRWQDPAPLRGPLTVAALSRETFSRLTGDPSGSVGGFTTGPDLFVVPVDSAQRRSADDDVVVAHELSHIQDFREGGARLDEVPIYVQEGKAYLLGDRGAMTGGVQPRNVADVTRALARIGGDDAALVMRSFRHARDEATWGRDGFYGEIIGALYVEFLRLHFRGGRRDTVRRIAQALVEVRQGTTWDAAFRKQFGATPAASEAAFVAWVRATEWNPELRLRGTLYDPAKTMRAA